MNEETRMFVAEEKITGTTTLVFRHERFGSYDDSSTISG
jgi:hypothetical protein